MVIALFVVLTGTTGMVAGVCAAAGEEIGWRGFLVPELARVLPFTGVALVWLLLRTDSVWPGIFLHASHNLWMQSIFFPLTSERADTKWVAGDLGLAFVVVAAVVAAAFWAKRGALTLTK